MIRKRQLSKTIKLLLSSLSITTFCSSAVWAQNDEEGFGYLEEVVVTAQKREQNLQDVPVSITALRGDNLDIASSAGADIRFLSARVPSLIAESSFGRTFPRFYLRGLGNTDFDLNASQPVSLVYDGVVLENPIAKGFPVFDMERIEVLRGPQGTLFGRNTPAGIIKFESVKPTQETEGYARLSYGRFNQLDFEGAIGGALSPTLSGRFSLMFQDRDDYIDNEAPGLEEDDALEGFDELAWRGQLLWTPNDQLSALFNLHGRDLDGTARVFRANVIQPGTGGLIPGFDRDSVSHDAIPNVFQDVESFGGSATIEYDFGNITLTSITGYEEVEILTRGDIDGGFGAAFLPVSGPGFVPFAAETADGIPDHDQFTQEIRLSSNEWGDFDWQAGFFYFSEDLTIDSFNFDTLAGGAPDGFAQQQQETTAWALFGSIDYDINERLILTAGLRYSDEEKEYTAVRTVAPFINQLLFGAGPLGPISVNPEDDVLTGDISLNYAVNDDVNVYGKIARGFRAPSIQGRILFGDAVTVADTETILSFEAGVKSELLDGRMRLNAAVYSYQIDDQQLTAVGGGANFNQLVNADTTDGFGFEADLEWIPNESWIISAGLSYNDTEIDDPNLAIAPCGASCTLLDPAGPVDGTVLIDGNPLPHAPEWIANWNIRYEFPFRNGEIYIQNDGAYRDDINFFLYESEEFSSDELIEVGLRVGYRFNNDRSEFALFGRNIFDDEVLTGGIDFNNLTGFVNEPRVWGIEYNTRF